MKRIFEILLLLFCAFPILAQDGKTTTITGVVTEKFSGEPLIGVSVIVPGTSRGVMTDVNGHYSLLVQSNDTFLKFSYIGFITETVSINGQTQINVGLNEDIQKLGDVVVVGYGVQKKSDLTGSISTVDMDKIGLRVAGTIDQALQGQVAGVDATINSGTPGAAASIRIRGIGTINDANPLFVVDGMMVSDINFLNPGDIENMQVLKDASATAIYGSRGSSGVIIITTKKGQAGQSKISINSYYGVQNIWKTANVLDGPTWGYLKNEALVAAGVEPAIADPSILPTTDYFDEILHKNSPVSNLDVSVSGGTDKGNYFVSVNNFDQSGIIKKTSFSRTSLRVNSSYDVKPWLRIGENITLAKEKSQQGVEGDEWTSMIITAIARDPVSPARKPDGSYAKGIYNDTWNPLAVIDYHNNNDKVYRTIGNIYADLAFLKKFLLRSSYSIEYSFGETTNYEPVYYVFAVQQNSISKLSVNNSNRLITQWSNTLTYENDFGKSHISAMAGVETYSNDYGYNGLNVNNIPSDNIDIRHIDNALGKNSATVWGSISQERQFSGFARINYSYNNKYLLTANFRADASSKFTENNRWGYFPSFSMGWKLSEEPFIQSVNFISSLKLRAGWGQIGNEGSVAPYSYNTSASSGANYLWGGVLAPGFCFPGAGNPEIKWETSTTTNVGLDFGLFEGRASGSIEYYIKNTDGMLLRVPVPGQTGIQSWPYQNAGEMKNSGIEVSALYKNSTRNLNYSFGVNFSSNTNEVINIGANNGFIDGAPFMNSVNLTRTVVGRPIAQFYGYKTEGLFQNWEEVNAQTAQENVAPGDVRYVDADNDGELDFYFLGSPIPDFTLSFNVGLEYKGFDLGIMAQGIYGNKIINGPAYYTRSSSAAQNLSREMINRWTGEGTQNDARYPRMNSNDVNNSLFSDRMVEDGSYFRIKNVQFGYTIPSSVTKNIGIDNLRIYLSSQNLFTFTKYSGLDPEVGLRDYYNQLDMGVDRGNYPQARTYSMGLSINF